MEAARARLQAVKADKPPETFTEALMDFIPRVTPRWEKPLHLKPYVDALENLYGQERRIVFSAPPQHSKSQTTAHFLVHHLLKHPETRNAYATYSATKAERVAYDAKNIADRAGLSLQTDNLNLWRTKQGGQVLWTSVGGAMTGEPIDGVLIIDDPIKDRKDAESATIRQNQKDWFHSVAETRLHNGASVVVMMTRWHSDDLSGYLVKHAKFELINLKAIADERRPVGDDRNPGEALWEAKHPIARLRKLQIVNPWNFASMYQGEPQPRGSARFKDVSYYTELPTRGFRIVYGVDLAYSEDTRSDWSVCLELWAVPPPRGYAKNEDDHLEWEFYVTDVIRKQVEAPAFTLTLRAKQSRSSSRFHWYASGTEKGAGTFIKQKGIPLHIMDPNGRDKLMRSEKTAECWNASRIHVPEDAAANPWVDLFLEEVANFTGVKDVHDDQVDALVAAVDAALAGEGASDDIPERSGGRYT
jgi:predicted phage terminase large subunit-like protein